MTFTVCRRDRNLFVAIVLCVVAALIVGLDLISAWWPDQHVRLVLRRVYDSVDLGDPSKELLTEIHKTGLKHSSSTYEGFDMHVVKTPSEFGAQNWLLVALVDPRADAVVAIGVRSDDGFTQHPSDAPMDRVSPSVEAPWRKLFTLVR